MRREEKRREKPTFVPICRFRRGEDHHRREFGLTALGLPLPLIIVVPLAKGSVDIA
jgi:hypothetical protein